MRPVGVGGVVHGCWCDTRGIAGGKGRGRGRVAVVAVACGHGGGRGQFAWLAAMAV